jgi:hypothetical protein
MLMRGEDLYSWQSKEKTKNFTQRARRYRVHREENEEEKEKTGTACRAPTGRNFGGDEKAKDFVRLM